MATIDLRGKPIAITGASSGIGRATALACARAGMPVVVGARRLTALEAVVAEVRAAGGKAEAVVCDVDREEDCRAFIARAEAACGPLYALFANAGYGLEGPADTLTDDQLHAIIRTNFFGTLWAVRAALPSMRRAGRGHILICSSCVSKMGLPYHAAYSATKAMQDHFGRALRVELAVSGGGAGGGIHVSTVHPIGVRTEFSERVAERAGGERKAVRTPESMKQDPAYIASLIVRGLQRPRGEIWTHWPTRVGMALLTALPGVCDWYLARRLRRQHPQL